MSSVSFVAYGFGRLKIVKKEIVWVELRVGHSKSATLTGSNTHEDELLLQACDPYWVEAERFIRLPKEKPFSVELTL
jgi:hypothetical protein